jgi:hypothetical protein
MAHHQFTTPRVVYLGQTYRGREDRSPASEPRAPRAGAVAVAVTAELPQEPWARQVSSPAASR